MNKKVKKNASVFFDKCPVLPGQCHIGKKTTKHYLLNSSCPKCGENKHINIIKLRYDYWECRTCGHLCLKTERLEKRFKNAQDW